MSIKWCLLLFIVFHVLPRESATQGSGDAAGIWSDDSDLNLTSNYNTHKNSNLVNNLTANNLTRNASDFHYIARDDHEVVHNVRRQMRRLSRKRGAKFCWVSTVCIWKDLSCWPQYTYGFREWIWATWISEGSFH